MLSRLFQPKRPPPAVPDGVVVFAFGDVHGRVDLLRALLTRILAPDEAGGDRPVVIGLGDYIDRGPASSEVLELLVDLAGVSTLETHFLRGNHDQTLLDFLREPMTGPAWCEFGGREAMMSYGVRPPAGRATPEAWTAARDALAAALPAEHLAWLNALKTHVEIGDYFFAHAGARPGTPLALQSDQDLMWIREPFLSDPRPFEKVVVHGHSAGELIHADRRRINVDTGAYATGQLTAVRLQGTDQSFLYTRRGEGGFIVETARAE
jgi:serine/threonine protein phosphatase 1